MLSRKYRIHAFLALLALVIIFYPSYSRKPDKQKITASTAAATQFLKLVDAGEYDQSWQGCAAYLKQQIPLSEWVKKLSAVRSAAGSLVERKQDDYVYTKDKKPKDGIPAGEYMVYTYNSKFQTKGQATETVTVMLGQDNTWRVAGYFIK